jgi:hypothetical protein
MISKNLRSLALVTAMIVVVTACESQSTATGASSADVLEARDAFVADLKQCTQKHGYDPNAAGLPENALAPNELPWRQCAYDAAHKYGQANPAVSDRYEQLITEDLQMTTAIQQGTMTRSQRRTRVEQLIEQIKAAEDAQIKAATSEQERQQQQLRNVVEGARGFAN